MCDELVTILLLFSLYLCGSGFFTHLFKRRAVSRNANFYSCCTQLTEAKDTNCINKTYSRKIAFFAFSTDQFEMRFLRSLLIPNRKSQISRKRFIIACMDGGCSSSFSQTKITRFTIASRSSFFVLFEELIRISEKVGIFR